MSLQDISKAIGEPTGSYSHQGKVYKALPGGCKECIFAVIKNKTCLKSGVFKCNLHNTHHFEEELPIKGIIRKAKEKRGIL